jgi:hypothetical protein
MEKMCQEASPIRTNKIVRIPIFWLAVWVYNKGGKLYAMFI